ncbi:MAG: NACHT domain-containing protein, partial [Candidatus Udaeobacter sp.]
IELTSAQKVRVLRVLAMEMMIREVREIGVPEASTLIDSTLKLVAPDLQPETFLSMIEDSSALLTQKENGVYGFAHLTFQEYLASVHVKEERLATTLADQVDNPWWHETARLYAAQSDASPILERCLLYERPALEVLLLAGDCEREALELAEHLRDRLKNITIGMVEDCEPHRRRHAAEYLLERRLREMPQVSDNRYIDSSPVTNAEYQLFIEELKVRGEQRSPDHWRQEYFADGMGLYPVTDYGSAMPKTSAVG